MQPELVVYAKSQAKKNESDAAKGQESCGATNSNNYSINKVYPAVKVIKSGCFSMSCLAGESNMR
jgi:hypothetical protein